MRMSSLAGIAGLLLAGLPLAPSVATTAAPAPPPHRGAASAPAGGGPQSPADVYRWLEDPEMTGEGQQQPHVQLTPYASAADARAAAEGADQPSPWVQSLDGTWRLDIVRRPQAVPERFWARGHDTSGWDRVQVPHTWQSDFLDHPVFRNIPEEIYPDDPPAVPHDINPTGAYVRSFAVADDWDGRRTMLRFEGVTSGYFVWVNGRYIGYDQGGYTPAEFDVTDALHPGRNRVAVQVHRWGSGSYLEDVDQWRYSGMFRDVWMYSTPDTRITDAYVTTDVSDDTESATVTDTVDVERPTEQAGEAATYRLRQTLFAPDGSRADRRSVPVSFGAGETSAQAPIETELTAPALWSAEDPRLHALVLELVDGDGRSVQAVSQAIGVREVAVADNQVEVNGGRILIRGVNRAETDPDTGRAATRDAMERDVRLMKRLNVNAVRTSHYPSHPYLYDLADRHGLWVDDEIDIETHAHESCPDDCLASRPEWAAAYADRFAAMVERDKNHPSVIFWDTGNEAGLGEAHYDMADWADAHEPTRLLYHQSNSPDGDAPFADVAGPRYPTPDRLEAKAEETTKPIVMGEYAHAMGNGLGNFSDFWELTREYPQIQGGFIWDWAEQNLDQPLFLTPDSSAGHVQTFLVGKPEQVAGHDGRGLRLSGLDDFVDVFRDRSLDVTDGLTLDAWVRPGPWAGSMPIITKGESYGLQMTDRETLELGVDVGERATVSATVPDDWYGAWHHVTGSYDGSRLRLFVDGERLARAPASGAIDPGLWEVNVGRNAEVQRDQTETRLAAMTVDSVRIHPRALPPGRAGSPEGAVLALDFEQLRQRGEFSSLGVSLSGTDGLVSSHRDLQPEVQTMAQAQSPIRFGAPDESGRVAVTNEQQAGSLPVRLRWSLDEVGRTLAAGTRQVTLAPGQTRHLALPDQPANPRDVERWWTLTARSAQDTWWADAGWLISRAQFDAGGTTVPGVQLPPRRDGQAPAPTVHRAGGELTVSGPGWTYRFDTGSGRMVSMDSRGEPVLRTGPRLDVWRPPTSNETYDWGTDDRRLWHDIGLDALRTRARSVRTSTEPGGAVTVEVASRTAAPGKAALAHFDQTLTYRIDARGTIGLRHQVAPGGSDVGSLPYLPRLGLQLQVPERLHDFAWYGRGPFETYNDRTEGSVVDTWHSTVDEQYVAYSRPQAHGNHHETRWATLSDGARTGLLVAAAPDRTVDVSVTPYDDLDRAEYDFQLPLVRNRGWSTLHVESGETGMGETPNSVLAPYRVSPTEPADYEVTLRPLTRREVSAGGEPDPDGPVVCPPDVTVPDDLAVDEDGAVTVPVTVAARCAGGIRQTELALTVPDGWDVEPATSELGTVALGEPETVDVEVTAPDDAEPGAHPVTAAVSFVSPPGLAARITTDATVSVPLPAGEHWVSDLSFSSETNGWGPVERDTSNGEDAPGDGVPLSIGGNTFAKGLGVHADSLVEVALDGGCSSFTSTVGVDDEVDDDGSVVFEVLADGEVVATSATLHGGDDGEVLTADLTGAEVLGLHVADSGDGNGRDHADWGGARLTCEG